MSIGNGDGASQPQSLDYSTTVRTKNLDRPSLTVLVECLNETGWTTWEAITAAMQREDLSFVRKVLIGERPMPEGFFDALPHQARGLYHAKQAEALGWIAVQPAEPEAAFRYLAIGLLSMAARGVASVLPTKARGMAKMGEQQTTNRKAAV
jgi:hypothetical protein